MARAKKVPEGVSASVLGEHVDLTRQRVAQLVEEGVLTPLANGRFDLDACRLAYIRWLRSEDRRANKSAAESRVRDARAREIEQRMRERERTHIREAEEVALAFVDHVLGPLKPAIYGTPAALTQDLDLRRRFEKAFDVHFNDAAERASRFSTAADEEQDA